MKITKKKGWAFGSCENIEGCGYPTKAEVLSALQAFREKEGLARAPRLGYVGEATRLLPVQCNLEWMDLVEEEICIEMNDAAQREFNALMTATASRFFTELGPKLEVWVIDEVEPVDAPMINIDPWRRAIQKAREDGIILAD